MKNITTTTHDYITIDNYGKRTNLKKLNGGVREYVKNILTKNPNATYTEIMLEVDHYMDEVAKSGTKISSIRKKVIGGLQQIIDDVNTEIKKEITTQEYLLRQTQYSSQIIPVNELTNEVIKANSNIPLNIMQNNETSVNETIEEAVPKIETSKNFTQDTKTDGYLSSKKKKAQKKRKEIQVQKEKQIARRTNEKSARNARYLTQNELMSTEARRAYERVECNNLHFTPNQAVDSAHVFAVKNAKESADVFIANGFPPIKNAAQESADVFIANGFPPIKNAAQESAEIFIKKGVTAFERSLDTIDELEKKLANIKTKEKVKTVVKEVPVEKTIVKEVVKENVKEVPKEVIKEVPKTNIWAIAGAVFIGGIMTLLGTKLLDNKQST